MEYDGSYAGPESPSVQLCGWQHWSLVALDRRTVIARRKCPRLHGKHAYYIILIHFIYYIYYILYHIAPDTIIAWMLPPLFPHPPSRPLPCWTLNCEAPVTFVAIKVQFSLDIRCVHFVWKVALAAGCAMLCLWHPIPQLPAWLIVLESRKSVGQTSGNGLSPMDRNAGFRC